MNLFVLVLREIVHRRLNVILGLLSVASAAACLMTAAPGPVDDHQLRELHVRTIKPAKEA